MAILKLFSGNLIPFAHLIYSSSRQTETGGPWWPAPYSAASVESRSCAVACGCRFDDVGRTSRVPRTAKPYQLWWSKWQHRISFQSFALYLFCIGRVNTMMCSVLLRPVLLGCFFRRWHSASEWTMQELSSHRVGSYPCTDCRSTQSFCHDPLSNDI